MASVNYIFTITDNTSGTVTLTGTPYALYSGGGLTADRSQATVAETYEVRLTDGTATANLEELRVLNNLLRMAEDRQQNPELSRVYITWQEAGTASTLWRSEIKRGRAETRADALNYPYWSNDTTFAPIYIERENYWEGPEAEVASGTVYGQSVSGTVNYISIAGTAVIGDLPGATRIEITNSYNSETRLSSVYIGHNANSAPASFPHILEGEASTMGTATSNASSSGGYFMPATATTTDAIKYIFDLSTAMMNCLKGAPVRVLAKFVPDLPNNVYAYIQIKIGVIPLYTSPRMLLTAKNVEEIATVRLPPQILSNPVYPLIMQIWLQAMDGAAASCQLDFLQLMPLDSWRVIQSIGYDTAYQARIVDDGFQNELYTDGWTDAGKVPNYIGIGDPVKLYPGKDQRLYFLASNAEIARTMSVKVYYRPRRLSL